MQHYKLVEKQKELDERDVKRKKNLEKMKDETYRRMSQKRKLMQEKIKKALIKNEFSRTVTVLTLHIIQIEIVMKQVEQ